MTISVEAEHISVLLIDFFNTKLGLLLWIIIELNVFLSE